MNENICSAWKQLCKIDFNFYDSKVGEKREISFDELKVRILQILGDEYKEGKVVINGGHFVPNINNPDKIGKNSLETWGLACELTGMLKENKFDAHISLLINDISLSPEERKKLCLGLPKPYGDLMKKYYLEITDLMNYSNNPKTVYSEKKLANRYVHQKQNKKWDLYEKEEVDNYCSAAFIPYFRDIKKQKTKISIWIICKCASKNLITAIELFSKREGDLRNICFFVTDNCF